VLSDRADALLVRRDRNDCPIHPGAHPMVVEVTGSTIDASCPVTGEVVRSASY
jgi:hypothetical protein